MIGAVKIMGGLVCAPELDSACHSSILTPTLSITLTRVFGMFRTIASYTTASTVIMVGSLVVSFGPGGLIAVPKHN